MDRFRAERDEVPGIVVGGLRLREPAVGLLLEGCTMSGNLIASWMKNTGMLLPTMSQFPSFVYSFTAKPRTSRARSDDPLLPATVEKRRKAGVLSPARWKMSARVRSESDS
jgi:hypothetical protein